MGNSLLGQGSLTTYNPTFREKASDLLRGLLFSDDRAGQRKAERLLGVLETTSPVGVATGIDDMREAVGQGDYASAGLLGAMAMVPGPSPKIKAYHGSPHSFDRFSMDKIGTGEGAQAYGHGLYFAENEGVAKQYRDQLAGLPTLDGNSSVFAGLPWTSRNTEKLAREALQNATKKGLQGDDAVKDAMEALTNQGNVASSSSVRQPNYDAANAIGALLGKKWDVSPGSMYEVSINASPDDFLDWDKPFQSPDDLERFAAKFDATAPELRRRIEDYGYMRQQQDGSLPDGNDLIREIFGGIGDKSAVSASRTMQEAGIPGIKYLDAGSRGTSGGEILDVAKGPDGFRVKIKKFGGGMIGAAPTDMVTTSRPFPTEEAARKWANDQIATGTRNYVVFDDKLIEIVRKYGIAGASAMLGYNLLEGVSPAEAKQLQNIELASKPLLGGGGW